MIFFANELGLLLLSTDHHIRDTFVSCHVNITMKMGVQKEFRL